MNIVEFLEARIAEDEAAVERRGDGSHSIHATDAYGAFNSRCPDCLGLPAKSRVLAECKAKRAIIVDYVERLRRWERSPGRIGFPGCNHYEAEPDNTVICALAAVYADHPDYREEWRHA